MPCPHPARRGAQHPAGWLGCCCIPQEMGMGSSSKAAAASHGVYTATSLASVDAVRHQGEHHTAISKWPPPRPPQTQASFCVSVRSGPQGGAVQVAAARRRSRMSGSLCHLVALQVIVVFRIGLDMTGIRVGSADGLSVTTSHHQTKASLL